MSKRPSQGSPTSQRSFKKQKVSPPSPSSTMSTLITKEQHIPVLSDVPTSSATPAYGPTAANSFGKFGQPSPSLLGFAEGGLASDSKGWTKVEKQKDKKKRKEEQKSVVSFYHFRSWRLAFNAFVGLQLQPASFAFNLEDMKKRDPVTIAVSRSVRKSNAPLC